MPVPKFFSEATFGKIFALLGSYKTAALLILVPVAALEVEGYC